jgi:hypothetical protein
MWSKIYMLRLNEPKILDSQDPITYKPKIGGYTRASPVLSTWPVSIFDHSHYLLLCQIPPLDWSLGENKCNATQTWLPRQPREISVEVTVGFRIWRTPWGTARNYKLFTSRHRTTYTHRTATSASDKSHTRKRYIQAMVFINIYKTLYQWLTY